jgi:signal transduction histidine kinase
MPWIRRSADVLTRFDPYRWSVVFDTRARQTWVVDGALAVLFTLAVLGISHRLGPDEHGRALDTLGYACIVVAGGSLTFRRRLPLTVLGVSSLAMVVYAARSYPGGPVYVAPVIAMYTLATLTPRRVWVPSVLVSVGAISIVGAIWANDTGTSWFHLVYFTWGIAAGFVGDGVRLRREHVLAVEERSRHLEETREQEGRRLVAEERLRIARELHDVVAHSLASINVQASAGAHVAASHPDQAQAALLAIKSASKEALDELRLTLGTLRSHDENAPRAPAPSLTRLDELVERTRRAGLPVTIVVEGRAAPVPAPVDVAAYRIVQESLTNALRHAGPALATVRIAYLDDAIEIEVTDDGLGSLAFNASPGHGIAGMRERAHGVGGSLDAGAVRGGGFRVHAILPSRVEVTS